MKVQSILALAVVALAAAACGGGGGGGSTPASTGVLPGGGTAGGGTTTVSPTPVAVVTTPAAGGSSGSTATFKIMIPASASGSSTARRPANIAAGSNSITIQLIEAGGVPVTGTPQTFGIAPTSPGCAQANSVTTCTLSVSAPIGNDVFLAQTYASTNGTGALLSSGAVAVTVAANATNTASVSLDGTVSAIYLASANFYLGTYSDSAKSRTTPQSTTRKTAQVTNGTLVSSTRIFVIATDNEGNAILNPTTYSTPITLQQTFDYGTNPNVTLSVQSAATGQTTSTSVGYGTVTVTSPSDVITATLINNVTNPSSDVLLAAYLGSAPAAPTGTGYPSPLPSNVAASLDIYIYVPQTPQPLSVETNPWNLTATGTSYNYIYGGSGTYSLNAPGCAGFISLTIEDNYFIYGNATAAGSCTATLSDSSGDTPVQIQITVTTTSVSGS